MATKKKRTFTAEYRAEVVALAQKDDRPLAHVARELDLEASTVRMWVRQAAVDSGQGSSGALTTSEREEFAALKREVKTLRLEREILKKAAAFFAKETT